MILSIGWKNVWRNKIRSLVVIIAVMLGIFGGVMATGIMVHTALEAFETLKEVGISARIVNISTVKPIDEELIASCSKETAGIITIEDHNKYGGLGSAVAQVLATGNLTGLEIIAIDDVFGESGEAPDLHQKYGLNVESIVAAAKRLVNKG